MERTTVGQPLSRWIVQSLSLLLFVFVSLLVGCGGGNDDGGGPANTPPTASFVAAPVSGAAPLTVALDASESSDRDGQITTYSWRFGDGTASGAGAIASHVYQAPGSFTLTLTVTDDKGATGLASQQIEVARAPLQAKFSPERESGYVDAVMRFDASASAAPDGKIVDYAWNFADGGTGQGVVVDHRYSAVGVYVVRLTVRDDSGRSASSESTVSVRPEYEFPSYQMLDLGTLGGRVSVGTAINEAGQVTGLAENAGGMRRAFLASSTQPMVDLGTLGGQSSEGWAINNAGQVTGWSNTAGETHAFVASAGQPMIDLGTLGGPYSYGWAINDAGQVTGLAATAQGYRHAFMASAGQPMVDLGALGGGSSEGLAINDVGQVTGKVYVAGHVHAFVAGPTQPMADLGTLAGNSSVGTAINDAGQVTGQAFNDWTAINRYSRAFVASAGQPMVDLGVDGYGTDINNSGLVMGQTSAQLQDAHAFVASATQPMVDLGAMGGRVSYGYDMNESGQVTGFAERWAGGRHAFVASATQPMVDIGGHNSEGRAINDAGQITGVSFSPDDAHAFLATPISRLFAQLVEATGVVSGASQLVAELTSAEAALKDRNLPQSCEDLGQYQAAVADLSPGVIHAADADKLLKQSSTIAEALECP